MDTGGGLPGEFADLQHSHDLKLKNDQLAEKELIISELRTKEAQAIVEFREEFKAKLQQLNDRLLASEVHGRDRLQQLREVEEKKSLLESELRMAREEKSDALTKLARLLEQNARLQRELHDAQNERNSRITSNLQIEMEKREKELIIDRQKCDIERLRREMSQIRAIEKTLEVEVSTFKSDLDKKQERIDRQQRDIDLLRRQNADEIMEVKSRFEVERRDLQEKIHNHELQTQSEFRSKVSELSAQQRLQEQEFHRKLREKDSYLQDALDDARRVLDQKLRDKERDLREEFKRYTEDRDVALKYQSEQDRNEMSVRHNRLLEDERLACADKLTAADAKLRSVIERCSTAESELQQVKYDLADAQRGRKRAEDDLVRYRQEIETHSGKMENSQFELSALQRNLQEVEAELKGMREKSGRVEKRNRDLENMLAEMSGECTRANGDLESAQTELSVVKSQCKELETKLHDYVMKLSLAKQLDSKVKAVGILVADEELHRQRSIMDFLECCNDLKLEALACVHELTVEQYRTWLRMARDETKLQRLYPFLGLEIAEEVVTTDHYFTGVKVSGVKAGSPASISGVCPNDLVKGIEVLHVAVVKDLYDFRLAMEKVRPNDVITVTLQRGEEIFSREIAVGSSDKDHHRMPTRRKV